MATKQGSKKPASHGSTVKESASKGSSKDITEEALSTATLVMSMYVISTYEQKQKVAQLIMDEKINTALPLSEIAKKLQQSDKFTKIVNNG